MQVDLNATLLHCTYGVFKGAKQSLPLPLGFEHFQYISLK